MPLPAHARLEIFLDLEVVYIVYKAVYLSGGYLPYLYGYVSELINRWENLLILITLLPSLTKIAYPLPQSF